jgi:hypothetical protein
MTDVEPLAFLAPMASFIQECQPCQPRVPTLYLLTPRIYWGGGKSDKNAKFGGSNPFKAFPKGTEVSLGGLLELND